MFLWTCKIPGNPKNRDVACRLSGDGASPVFTGSSLFVAERFDGVEAGGADRGHHTADQSDGSEDEDGDDEGNGVDHEADVAGFGVFGHGAVKCKSAYGESDYVRQDNAEQSADEGDGESFGQKLEEDVPPSRPQRLLHSDFSGALGDGDEHDVHQADAADAQREGADESEQNLETESDDLELVDLLHEIEHHECAAVGGIESVLRGHGVAHGLLNPCIVVGLVIEPDGVEVVSVLEVTHGGEGDVDDAIDIVVAGLHLGAENTDDLKADAINTNALAQGVASGEKFFFGVGTDHGDARALHLILSVIEATLIEGESPDGKSVRVFAIDAHGERAGVVLHGSLLVAAGSDVGNLWNVGSEQVDVLEREAGLRAGFLAAGLHGRAAGNHDDELGPEVGEDVGAGAAEAIAVGKEHADGGNAPGHAEHGEGGTAPVVAHRVVGLMEQITHHRVGLFFTTLCQPHCSCRKASTGSRRAALRAG